MHRSDRLADTYFLNLLRRIYLISSVIVIFIYFYYSWSNFIFENDIPSKVVESFGEITFPDFTIWHFDPNNGINYNNYYVELVENNDHIKIYTDPYAKESTMSITNITCYKNFHMNITDDLKRHISYTNSSQFPSCGDSIKLHLDDQEWNFFSNLTSFPPVTTSKYLEDNVDLIILNITSNVQSSPTNSLSDYFGIVFDIVHIQNKHISINNNMVPIPRGHVVVLEFSTIIRERYSLPLYGSFGLSPDLQTAYIDTNTKDLTPILNSSYTLLVLKPKNHLITYIVEDQYSIGGIISNIGGFYAALEAIFAFFFGSPKYSPWGCCQTFPCWRPFRRSLKRHFARHYISGAGIPFVDDPRKLPRGASIEYRVAVLENLLKEYYLDVSYLEMIANTREKYITLEKAYKELETEESNVDESIAIMEDIDE